MSTVCVARQNRIENNGAGVPRSERPAFRLYDLHAGVEAKKVELPHAGFATAAFQYDRSRVGPSGWRRAGTSVKKSKIPDFGLQPIVRPEVMADRHPSTVTALLARASRVVEGVILDDLWLTSGDTFDQEHVDLLVQVEPTREVLRLRVVGVGAQAVAGGFGRGDRVQALVRHELAGEGVVLVEDVVAG